MLGPQAVMVVRVIDPVILRDAVVFASLLSLLSIGLTLTYLTTKVPNFAHGSTATVGTYAVYTCTVLLGLNPYASFPVAVASGSIVALGMYLLVLRPLIRRGASIVVLMISTLAFELVILSVLRIYVDYLSRVFKPSPSPTGFTLKSLDIRFYNYPLIFIVAPLVLAVVTVMLHLMLTKTRFGVALRASIENPSLASVFGINVEFMYAVSWALAGALAGLAGSFASLWYFTHTAYGSNLLPSIFAASILGGLTSVYGAIAGGLLMGFAEVLGTRVLVSILGTWVSPYRPLIPLVVMSIVLLLTPRGLTGLVYSIREARARGRA